MTATVQALQRKSAHLVTPTPWKIGKIKTIKAVILAYTASFVVLSRLDASADHQWLAQPARVSRGKQESEEDGFPEESDPFCGEPT